MMYVAKANLWEHLYTPGEVYEAEPSGVENILIVRNNDGEKEKMSLSWFRVASLEDAYSKTHYLNGQPAPAPAVLSPGLERPAYAPNPPAKASETQVGGAHYKTAAIQPAVFAERNKLTHLEANVVKRVFRHSRGGKGREDIEKAIHELQFLLELHY